MRPAPFSALAVLLALLATPACSRAHDEQAAPSAPDAAATRTDAGPPLGAPRPGMAWIPPGTFRAGTPPARAPRVAEEELPALPIEMRGFYMDLFPYPNEPGAIPTTNVARADAERLCAAANKRLCTELEWERACKGPSSTTYEYGDDYRSGTCGTGVPVEQSAKEPSGQKVACASAFGPRDMHGGVWEWTASAWGRGTTDPELGVLRGGNAVAGELVARCANGIGRASTTHGATMGFRCCAGPANEAKVDLTLTQGAPLERSTDPVSLAAPLIPLAKSRWIAQAGPAPFSRAWTWRPVPNEELVIAGGCARTVPLVCGAVIGRAAPPRVLAEIDTGRDYPDVAQIGDPRHIRIRGLELRGSILRDATFAYGLVDVAREKR